MTVTERRGSHRGRSTFRGKDKLPARYYDEPLELAVLGAVLYGLLTVDQLAPELFYVEAHNRLLAALRDAGAGAKNATVVGSFLAEEDRHFVVDAQAQALISAAEVGAGLARLRELVRVREDLGRISRQATELGFTVELPHEDSDNVTPIRPDIAAKRPENAAGTDGRPLRDERRGLLLGPEKGERALREVLIEGAAPQIVGIDTQAPAPGECPEVTHYRIRDTWRSERPELAVPVGDFPKMLWLASRWPGAMLRVSGASRREGVANALLQLANDDEVGATEALGQSGWAQVDGRWCFVHAAGVIAPDKPFAVPVHLPRQVQRYKLPSPPEAEQARHALRESLCLMDLGPDPFMASLLGAAYRAPIPGDRSRLTVWGHGHTNEGKSALMLLVLSHYGPELLARSTASWRSTLNDLEDAAWAARHMLWTCDDWQAGAAQGVARLTGIADDLRRAQFDGPSRGRQDRDLQHRPDKDPQGTWLTTAEDCPGTKSARDRCLAPQFPKGALDPTGTGAPALTEAQQKARAGIYAQAMSAYIRHMAQHYEALTEWSRQRWLELVRAANIIGASAHVHTCVAEAALGWQAFLWSCTELGALDMAEAEAWWARAWEGLCTAAAEQAVGVVEEGPARRFCDLLSQLLVTGRVHVRPSSPDDPRFTDNLASFGWAKDRHENDKPLPQGRMVGWVDFEASELLVLPTSALAETKELAKRSEEPFAETEATVGRRLREEGLLARVGDGRNIADKAPRRLDQSRQRVWVMTWDAVYPPSPSDSVGPVGPEPLEAPFFTPPELRFPRSERLARHTSQTPLLPGVPVPHVGPTKSLVSEPVSASGPTGPTFPDETPLIEHFMSSSALPVGLLYLPIGELGTCRACRATTTTRDGTGPICKRCAGPQIANGLGDLGRASATGPAHESPAAPSERPSQPRPVRSRPAKAYGRPGARLLGPPARSAVVVVAEGGQLVAVGEEERRVFEVPANVVGLAEIAREMGAEPLWVMPEARAACGLPDKAPRDAEAGDVAFLVAPEGEGWDLRYASGKVYGWRANDRNVFVRVIFGGWDRADPFGTLARPEDVAAALGAFQAAHGQAWAGSGGATWRELCPLRRLGPSWQPNTLLDGRTGEGQGFAWDRAVSGDEAGGWWHTFDRNGSFAAGLGDVAAGVGQPAHLVEPGTFDPKEKRPGWWCIVPPEDLDPSLPCPLTASGRLPGEGACWVTTPSAVYLAKDLGLELHYSHAWVWAESDRPFRGVQAKLREARAVLVTGTGVAAEVAYDAHKLVYSEGVNDLRANFWQRDLKREGALTEGPAGWQPYAQAAIVATSRVNTLRRVRKLPRRPIAAREVDEIVFACPEEDPLEAAAALGLPVGKELGQFKHKGSVPAPLAPAEGWQRRAVLGALKGRR